jgi:hypothetical protein
MKDYTALGKSLHERYDALKRLRSPWETLWMDIAKYVMPRRLPGLTGTLQSPSTQNDALLFDTTAIKANMTLANGQLAWMSPLEAAWFAFEPAPNQGDEAALWLSKATASARDELAISNFYTAVHEFYLDRGAFGTACLYVEGGRRRMLNAQTWPVGSFVLDEDDEGLVDTVMREFQMTPRQAAMKLGKENLSPKLREVLEKGGAKALEKVKFLHAIFPREDADRDKTKMDAENMPIASVYMELDGCHVCKDSGHEEMPVFVSRYLEWGSGMGGIYGWSPAFAALPDARQINFLEKMGDALAEKAAFPPVLAPEELEGELDGNANGVTYFSRDMAEANALPQEWMAKGRYDILNDRVKRREESINSHFHVDLFQMFAQIQKQMTAREVAERASEKLIQFSPTFSRLTSELFNPLLERVFGIGIRAGRFGEVPGTMVKPLNDTMGFVPVPKVQYSSRIALALRSLPSLGYQRTLERVAAVAALQPEVLDNFDFDKAERATSMSDGVPAEFLRPELQVQELRKARAAAAAEPQKQEAAAQAADAVAKVGKVPAGSPVGKAIESQLPQ